MAHLDGPCCGASSVAPSRRSACGRKCRPGQTKSISATSPATGPIVTSASARTRSTPISPTATAYLPTRAEGISSSTTQRASAPVQSRSAVWASHSTRTGACAGAVVSLASWASHAPTKASVTGRPRAKPSVWEPLPRPAMKASALARTTAPMTVGNAPSIQPVEHFAVTLRSNRSNQHARTNEGIPNEAGCDQRVTRPGFVRLCTTLQWVAPER